MSDNELEQLTLRTQLVEVQIQKTKLLTKVKPMQAKIVLLEKSEAELKGQIVLKRITCLTCKGSGKVDKTIQTGPNTVSTCEVQCTDCTGIGWTMEKL